jgi:hypothetical protein
MPGAEVKKWGWRLRQRFVSRVSALLEGRSVSDRRQLTEAWGEFLSQFSWDWFVTLTFRDEVKSFRAHRLFGYLMRDLETAAGVPIFWFRSDEIGECGGRFHMHALIGNVAHLRRLYWMDEWNRRAGYARILPFDCRRGAAYYVAKYVTKQLSDWALSENVETFRLYQPPLFPQRRGIPAGRLKG